MEIKASLLCSALSLAILAGSDASGAALEYYRNTVQWMTGPSGGGDFSIAFPIDFDESEMVPPQASTDWRWNMSDPGQVLLKVEIPRAIESQTNFDGAVLTVGRSNDAKAIADCLSAGDPSQKVSRATINAIPFTVIVGSDAGMSHYHEIVSYRTRHSGACYAVEYTINSTALGVYDPSMGLKAFNEKRVKAILARMVSTFRFR